ncbi:hypothetical protein [Niabella soli]|uniref:DUF4476 domain-containing protein n=1 Tax=Niabella soli DSM 19437 TaxID=929713 RepID=W0F6Z7_9BACT|nr:hypothetical protein [Niabella soli]AHF17598.1 hypothetical protein NIASO_10645 [Niabella soli DSM 19437]
MKKFLMLFSGIILISVCCAAQSVNAKLDLRPLLFKNFIPSSVLMKSGETAQVSLNYNTNNQSVIFVQEGVFMTLDNLDKIQTISIDKTVFVPIRGKVYQTTPDPDVFISYSNRPVVKKSGTDKSGIKETTSGEVSNDVSGIYMGRNYKNQDGLEFVKNIWALKGNKLLEIRSTKDLSKAYGVSKSDLDEYVKKNVNDFANQNEAIELLKYVRSLAKAK